MYAIQIVGETGLDAINNYLDILKRSFKFSTRAEVSRPIYTSVLTPYSRTATAAIAKLTYQPFPRADPQWNPLLVQPAPLYKTHPLQAVNPTQKR